jgi:hypothetical protein
MFGRVTRRVQHIDNDIAERESITVIRGMKRERHFGAGVQRILGPRRAGERSPRRAMIGMDMGIDDELDAHPGFVRDAEVWFNVAQRVYDGAGGVPAAAQQVGNCDRIAVEELAQDHACLLSSLGRHLDRRGSFNHFRD